MPSKRQRAVRAAIHVERDLYRVEDRVIRAIRADLLAAKDRTIIRLAAATAEWDIAQAQQVIAELERQMAYWERTASGSLGSAMGDASVIGREQVLAALKAGGIDVAVTPAISTAMVAVSQQTLPILITGVSNAVVREVAAILRASVLAQQTPFGAMQAISRFIPPKGAPGPFGAAFRRSEAIVRTELGRISQSANHSTLSNLARSDPGLMKEWVSSRLPNTRDSHSRAHGQRVRVDQPFIVGGAPLMYPHDPRGPARETVNCRCVSLPIHESWGRPTFGSRVTSIFR